jgi:hypothetical protein
VDVESHGRERNVMLWLFPFTLAILVTGGTLVLLRRRSSSRRTALAVGWPLPLFVGTLLQWRGNLLFASIAMLAGSVLMLGLLTLNVGPLYATWNPPGERDTTRLSDAVWFGGGLVVLVALAWWNWH